MKRNITCYLACLCLIIALALPFPVAMADLRTLDIPLLPEDTVAVVISPPNNDQPRIIYAIHGIAKDEDMLSIGVRQICTDPLLTIYKEYTSNVSELHIRQTNEFTRDQPIVGSFCEMYIEKDPDGETFSDRWCNLRSIKNIPRGYYMDETISFSLSDLGNIDEKISLRMDYNCIPVPGTLHGHPLCRLSIDLADYLNPANMPDLRTLDFSLLPEDTIAVVPSSLDCEHPEIVYAIHGIAKDDETLSVNVMQLSMDSQWKIYDADTAGVSEQEIRWVHGYPKDQPIVGSYCEGYIGKESDDPREQWVCYKQDGSIPCGNNMDEQFTFLLSEIEDGDEKIIFQMNYNCIPVPGAIYDTPHCLMTIDVSDYLK